MTLNDLHDFLIASVGASAGFIGLLFVALTLVMERAGTDNTISFRDRVLAESAYTALLTIFFISLVGLIPNVDIAWVLVVFGLLGMSQSIRMYVAGKKNKVYVGNKIVLSGLILIYGAIAFYGFYLRFSQEVLSFDVFFTMLFTLYGIALGRSWALIGLRSGSPKDK